METEQLETFERRYWENLRRRTLAPAIGHTALEAVQAEGLERRRYNELTSGLAEALPGVVRTEWVYEAKAGKLVAEDGQEIEQLLINGLHHSMRMAASDEFYEPFLPARARHELDELREQEAMVNNETEFNTIVTFSPYSEEYDSPKTRLKLKKAAQEPDWRRGMIRVSYAKNGLLYIFTRSVDESDTNLLREIAKRQFGYEFTATNSTEMLGERLHLDIKNDSWRDLADSLTGHADAVLSERNSGEWVQGRPVNEALDTQKYVESRTQIVQALLSASEKLAAQYEDFESYKNAYDKEIYNHIALLKLHNEVAKESGIVDIAHASTAAGAIAEARGDIYNMCGYVLAPEGAIAQTGARTGFESILRLSGKEVECPACKEKVVVPTQKLLEGKLCCRECKYEVDACTGKVYHKPENKKSVVEKSKREQNQHQETDWQRINREYNEKKAAQKQKRMEEQLARKVA